MLRMCAGTPVGAAARRSFGGACPQRCAFRGGGSSIGLYPWGAENGKCSCDKTSFLGKWQSVAAIWNGSQVSLYTNGVQALAPTTYTKSLTLSTTAAGFKIGKAFYNGTSYFSGNLDEVAVCNRVLTQAEIADYGKRGIEALMAKPLAENTRLTLATSATFASPYVSQTIAGLAGVGSVLVPDDLPDSGCWTLIRASSFVGAENFPKSTIQNLPHNRNAKLKVVNDNELTFSWTKKGFCLLIR